jgi:hypothetical protein
MGPLVVGLTAIRRDEALAGDDPWRDDLRARLRGVVCTAGGASRSGGRALPVPIDDSKRVRQRFGVEGLARGVGAFAAALDQAPPANLEDLLVRYAERGPGAYAAAPWFRDLARSPLPRYPWTGPLDGRLADRGLQAVDLRVLAADAPELNRDFRRLGNKASVLGLLTATLVLSVLDRHPGEDALVVFDRHGGRTDYRAYLGGVFPFARTTPQPAPRGEARYTVELPGRLLRVRFATRGDRLSLVVGWASMAAKLARELFMECLNAWFGARVPSLRPTAGYTTDGRRFLDDVGAVLAAEQIDPELLVRSR